MTEAETTSVDGSDAFGDVGSDAPGDSTPAMALWMSFGRLRWVPCRARIAADGRRVEVLRARRESSGRRGVAALEKHLVPPMPLLAGGALSRCRRKPPRGRDASSSRVPTPTPSPPRRAASRPPMHATKRATGPPPPHVTLSVYVCRRDQSRASIPNRRTGSAVERRGERRGARRETRGRRGCGRRRAGFVVARSARETRASNAEPRFGTVRVALDGTVLGVAQNHGDTRGGEPHRRRAARSR